MAIKWSKNKPALAIDMKVWSADESTTANHHK
jgi:hypothetical protein